MELLNVSPSKIQPSPFNPRKHSDKSFMLELTADVAARGVLQPLLVRQLGTEKYELIFGHQRHQAAKAAGLEKVPVLVREATDAEARVLQLVENLKRSDLSPMEVAEGYLELQTKDGLAAQQIAEKVGRSAQSVRDALKLTELGAEGRKALADGHISARHGLLIARVQPGQQAKATKEVMDGRYGRREVMTTDEAAAWIAEHYQVDLRQVVFDRTDEALGSPRFGVHPGSCVACPKRLVPDSENATTGKKATKEDTRARTVAGLCTDPPCCHDKTRQHAAAEAAKRGVKVLNVKETEKLFPHGHLATSNDYVSVDATNYDRGADFKKYKQLLTKEAAAPITVLAVSPKGELVELLERDGLKAALAKSGKMKKERGASAADKSEKARSKREKELELLRKAVTAAAMGAAVAKLELKGFNKKLLRHWADLVDQDATACERRWPSDAPVPSKHSVKQQLDKMNDAQLLAFCFEGSLGWQLRQTYGGYSSGLKTLCELTNVDLKKLEAEQKVALAAAAEKEAA